MNRLLSSILTLALVAGVGAGAASAKSKPCHDAKGKFVKCSAMAMPSSMHMDADDMHRSGHAMTTHKYGNDKARCRDSHGRFLKKSDPRCLNK
jgi:hypothetical protein